MTELIALRERESAAEPVRRRRWIWWLAAVLLLAAAVAPTTVWFVHWRASARLLVSYPAYGVQTPSAIDQPWYFGSNALLDDHTGEPATTASRSLTIESISPVVTQNTAAASVDVLRCVLSDARSGPVGTDTPDNCAHLTRLTAGHVTLGFRRGDVDIVIRITPHRAGIVRVSGVRIAYRDGWRHGRQHVGGQLVVRAAEASR